MLAFVEWLAATPGSIALHESHYLFLVVLTVHVLTLFVFAGLAAVIDLRLLGWMMRDVPAAELVARLVPLSVGGLCIMFVTGFLLFYSAPIDRYGNLFFRIKLMLLVLAGLNVFVFHKFVLTRVGEWDVARMPPTGARVAGGLGLLLWISIIVIGRMMAYEDYWFGN